MQLLINDILNNNDNVTCIIRHRLLSHTLLRGRLEDIGNSALDILTSYITYKSYINSNK